MMLELAGSAALSWTSASLELSADPAKQHMCGLPTYYYEAG